MEPGFDHLTLVVQDLDDAKSFFGLLGFQESKSTVVSGEEMSNYMGIPEWKADHVTLRLTDSPVHQELQLLRFYSPPVDIDAAHGSLRRTGFNHVCFRVNDLRSTLASLEKAGIRPRNEIMHFHDRDLVFLDGPEGVVIELAQWFEDPS